MRKVLTLEVWENETMSDSRECVSEVIRETMGHYYCCDGTVDIKIVENIYEDEDNIKMIEERMKNDNSIRYTIDEVKEMIKCKSDTSD